MVAVCLRLVATGLCAASLLSSTASSQDEADFYKAYYLEHEHGDLSAARALYREVADDRDVPKAMRAEAQRAADALGEDLASTDFTRLVPRDAILYAELSRPGEELSMLLSSLGLLGTIEEGQGIGVSPLLVEGLLGMRGAAVAVTSFDPERGPGGVLLVHPGDLDVIRGLIETALPAAGTPEDPIAGFPTWSFEGMAYATLTNRLLIAGTSRGEVEGVCERLRGGGGPSLADNPALSDVLDRGRDGLLSFCVNAEPVLPMISQMLGQQAAHDPEAAMMLAFLDIQSLRSVSGFIDVDPDGLTVELALELAEGHRNLAFNLLRLPQVERTTLERIPAGAAFFVALGLNPAGGAAPIARDAHGAPIVSFMDFGREIFGNLRDVTIYGMPAEGSGPPIPDLAVELRVNDVERSIALWDFALGTASGATGGQAGNPVEIAGQPATAYNLGGLPVYLAARADGIVISPSRSTMERAMKSGKRDRSILDDPVFADDIRAIEEGHTLVAMANPGRCIAFAGAMMSAREFEEMAPFADLLKDTVVTVGLEHTDTRLALSARVSALPDVSGLVADAMLGRRSHGYDVAAARPASAPMAVAVDEARPSGLVQASYVADAPAEAASLDSLGREDLKKVMTQLAAEGRDHEANQVGDVIFDQMFDEALALNDFAWMLATEEPFEGRFVPLCLKMSERSNELADFGNWFYLDTLALVMFQMGEVKEAIKLQMKAVEIAGDDPRAGEARAALERFEAALAEVAISEG